MADRLIGSETSSGGSEVERDLREIEGGAIDYRAFEPVSDIEVVAEGTRRGTSAFTRSGKVTGRS